MLSSFPFNLSLIPTKRGRKRRKGRERGKKKTTTTKISLFGSKLSTQLFLNAFSLIPFRTTHPRGG